MLAPIKPATSPKPSSSARIAAGADAADALYVGDAVVGRAGAARRARAASSRSEGEEIGLRLFVGQRSASVASSDLSATMRW